MASLGEYGEVPVSLYTGIAQVGVPLFSIESGNHKIDVNLSYHGGGVRPDSHPGWVGMGWTLHAGGSITRVVCGLPDESDNYQAQRDLYGAYFGQKRGLFYDRRWNYSRVSNTPFSWQSLAFPTSLTSGYPLVYPPTDIEPDRFMFNFMGYSGTFYYTCDAGWVVECDRPIKVIFDTNNSGNYSRVYHDLYDVIGSSEKTVKDSRSVSINNFLIIDEYGNKYYFGGKDHQEAIEYSVGYFNQHNSEIAATAWHLTKIEYADGRTAEFTYEKKDYVVEMGISDTYCTFIYEYFDINNSSIHRFKPGAMYNGVFLNGDFGANFYDKERDFADGSLIIPSYLTGINFGEYKVEFSTQESNELKYPMENICAMHFKPFSHNDWEHLAYLQQYEANGEVRTSTMGTGANRRLKWHKLTDISINNTAGNTLRKFSLHYNDEKEENHDKVRLCLEEVEEEGAGKYSFEYDRPECLPEYCSYNIDHWGFYKDTGIAERKISKQGLHSVTRLNTSIKYNTYSSHRDPDFDKGTIGSLMKIKYPTGGYTRFEYEPHDYSYKVKKDKTGLEQEYRPRQAGGIRIKTIYNSTSPDSIDEYVYKRYVYRDIVNDPANTSSGILLHPVRYAYKSDTIIYSQIREMYNAQGIRPQGLNADGCHVTYSKVSEIAPDGSITVHRYTDYHIYPDSVLEESPETGRFQYIIPSCSMASLRGQLLSQHCYSNEQKLVKSTHYTYSPEYATTIYTNKLVSTPSETGVFHDVYPVRIHTKANLPILICDTTYYPDNVKSGISTSIQYTQYGRMTKQVSNLYNDGTVERTMYQYPFDKDANNTIFKNMTDSTMWAYPVEIKKEVNEKGINKLAELIEYEYDATLNGLPTKIHRRIAEEDTPVTTLLKYGNLGTIISQKDTDTSDATIYVWGYNHQHIVAMIQYTTLEAVEKAIGNLDSFAQSAQPDFEKLETLRTKLPHSNVYIYKYKLGVGMSECVLPDGERVYYYYDDIGRLNYTTDSDKQVIEVYDYHYAQ